MSKQRNGFTLIELVVVILILGILAGVGAPKLFSTTDKANEAGVKQTLALVRNAIALYSADNNGDFPPCTGDGIGETNFHGAMTTYLRGNFPVCPVGDNKNNHVAPSAVDPLVADDQVEAGWLYNPETGEFICNSDLETPTSTTENPMKYSEL